MYFQTQFTLVVSLINIYVFLYLSAHRYHLLEHNCNIFSNEIAQFLCGSTIPNYILDLPNEILSTYVFSHFEFNLMS